MSFAWLEENLSSTAKGRAVSADADAVFAIALCSIKSIVRAPEKIALRIRRILRFRRGADRDGDATPFHY